MSSKSDSKPKSRIAVRSLRVLRASVRTNLAGLLVLTLIVVILMHLRASTIPDQFVPLLKSWQVTLTTCWTIGLVVILIGRSLPLFDPSKAEEPSILPGALLVDLVGVGMWGTAIFDVRFNPSYAFLAYLVSSAIFAVFLSRVAVARRLPNLWSIARFSINADVATLAVWIFVLFAKAYGWGHVNPMYAGMILFIAAHVLQILVLSRFDSEVGRRLAAWDDE